MSDLVDENAMITNVDWLTACRRPSFPRLHASE
jgi:hypothetical protein